MLEIQCGFPVGDTAMFKCGRVFVSRSCLKSVEADETYKGLLAHAHGDYGKAPKHAWPLNDKAIDENGVVLSSFTIAGNDRERFYIATFLSENRTYLFMEMEAMIGLAMMGVFPIDPNYGDEK